MKRFVNYHYKKKEIILFPLREHLKQWDNKEQWRDRLLEIYNE